VGRKKEGSSSNYPELKEFVLVLRDTPVTKPIRLSGKNLGMIELFSGWVREKFAWSTILKCGVSREILKT